MKRFLIVVLVISAMLSAAFVDQDGAKQVAENYYKNYAPVSAKGNEVKDIFAHKYEGQITWYGVSFDQGFVIVTADDALKPILGYSFDGKLVDPEVRDGGFAFKEWFGYMDKQVLVARKYNYVDAKAQTDWKDIRNNIFPSSSKLTYVDALVKSHWDQVYPWNDLCPEKSIGTWTYVGCVATAASMIMRYHEWPPTGDGSNSYSWDGRTLSETFSNYTFDYTVMNHDVNIEWGLYPEYWETIDMDAAAIQNLAELNYLVGQSFDMNYGDTADGGSGANMSTASTAMNTNWRYVSTYNTVGTPTDPSYIASTIQAELDAKRPWWWAGGVHSFILDGYADDYWYHFNWGWGGYQDGWFQITFLVPDGVGSGGGDGDYTASQIRISLVPDTNPFTAWPAPTGFNGTLVNGEDVQLSWNAASGAQSYNVWKATDMAGAVLLANTASTSYNDNDQVTGEYSYFVSAVYSDGESHHTDSYSVLIEPSVNFPTTRSFAAVADGRTSVDLTWLEPFTGFTNFLNDFEGGVIPADWFQKTTTALPPDYKGSSDNVSDPKPPDRSWFKDDLLDEIRLLDATTAPHIVFRGEYACIFATSATTHLWLMSPNYTFNSEHFFKFWTRFKYGDGASGTQHQIFSVVSYAGDFTDQATPTTITTIGTWDSAIDPTNEWESEWNVSLASLAGQTKHVGIMVEANDNDYYTFTIDDILIGSNSGGIADDPTGIAIYRNGSLVTTETGTATSWTDTNFVDGDNTYYLRALYPTGESLASKWITVNMDANPKPDYLTGVLNGSDDVDLAWYMPYGTPSHWATLIAPENCTTTVDYLEDTDCAKRRAEMKAENLGLYYPVTIDSIAGGFFEWDDDLWGSNTTFVIRLWDGHPLTGYTTTVGDNLLYESGVLTATPGEVYAVDCGTHVLNGTWNVEVETFDTATGHPSTLAGPSTGGINCYFFYTLEDSYNYYISSGPDPLSYCLMAYCTGADPTDPFKSAWSSSDATYEKKPVIDNSGRLVGDAVTSPKAIAQYNIYREGVQIGTSATTSYTDTNPVANVDNTYYVKAAYTNPVGESAASNSVVVAGPTGGSPDPDVPANVVTSIAGANLVIDWDVSANATGYDVYSSDDPYGTFTLAASVGTNQYTVPAASAKLFYYIVATN
ncbi:MAG: C10 family peptidase [Candidatus Delongbacteria bacterium]|nr:C10 family peptidase [Candidatus Delongbacteria bacterium]